MNFSKHRLIIGLSSIMIVIVSYWGINSHSRKNNNLNLSNATYYSEYPLPDADLVYIGGGENKKLINLKKGRVLLIHFATGCEARKKEFDIISQSIRELEAADVRVFAISIEEPEILRAFVRIRNLTFPVLFDKDTKLFNALKIKYAPSNFILRDGVIKSTWFGNPKDKTDFLDKLGIVQPKRK